MHVVRWRLLWEDKRYHDGSLPAEEDTYFPQPVAQPKPRALPGEPCPRTGYWQSPATKKRYTSRRGTPCPDLNSRRGERSSGTIAIRNRRAESGVSAALQYSPQ